VLPWHIEAKPRRISSYACLRKPGQARPSYKEKRGWNDDTREFFLRVLLVGGAGYIGSHVALRLSERGFIPVIYDNFSTGHRRFVDEFEIIRGEMADYECLRHSLKNVGAVMHFAAKAYVSESILNPREYYTINIADALTLLNATVDAGISKFIFFPAALYTELRSSFLSEKQHHEIQ
jgi:UDP-glucose 4-epimerase